VEAVAAGAGLADLLGADLAALAQFFRFAAWSPENDFVLPPRVSE
jgi:hypothetical protein